MVTMNNAVFWAVTPFGSCINGRFRRTELLVSANIVPSSLIASTLLTKELRSSETSALTRATRRHIPEDDILHSHRRENLKILHRINRLGFVAET
jgi:hypothetical protein